MNLGVPHSSGRKIIKHVLACFVLLLVSITIKYSVWQLHPQIFNDTPGYLVPALNLLNGRGYGAQENGFRSPTFPLFLAAQLAPLDTRAFASCTDAHRPACIGDAAKLPAGLFALRWIVLANILLGFGTTLLLYWIGWDRTSNQWVAFFFGAGYAWNLATAFWEISLLTETLTTFLLMLVVLLTLRVRPGSRWTTWALGLALGALALCHQLYLVFWLLPVAFLSLGDWRRGMRDVVRSVLPVLILPILCISAWSTFNYFVNGFFTPSTLSGYVLIQMVAPAVENLPEGYDGITQTYVGYRDAQVREVGTYSGAIYRAWRDMMNETDLTWSQISARLQTGSFYLAYHYPGVYLNSVRQVFAAFWDFALFHFDPIPGGVASLTARFTDATLQWLLNFLFWLAPLGWAACWFVQRKRKQPVFSRSTTRGFMFIYLVVWYAALVSSLTNFGDNARYRVVVLPLQYGIILNTLYLLWRSFLEPTLRRASLPYNWDKAHGCPL